MFWSSVVGGLRLLQHAEIWGGALAVLVVFLGFLFGSAALAKRTGSRALGCLTFVSIFLLPEILNAVYFAFVLPIVLGGGSATPGDAVSAHLGRIAYAGVVAAGVGFLIRLIPVISLPVRTTFSTFAQGVIIARMLVESPFGAAAGLPLVAVRLPSFGLLVGYLAVALVLGLIIGAPMWIHKKTRKVVVVRDEDGKVAGRRRPGPLELAIVPVAKVAGYLPVFMYLQYLAATRTP